MALHVLTMLAKSGDGNVKSECLASSVNTNAVVIRRLLGQLHQAGLVTSQTGAAGGSRLSKSAEEIDLSEIYNAVPCGEVFALHAKSPSKDCPVGRNIEMVLCNLQKEIDTSIAERLERYSLESVIGLIDGAHAAR